MRTGSVGRDLAILWNVGAIGRADDAALLARFCDRRDETAELAFRVIVERHGPMVLRSCQQVTGDLHDAQDAAQAVFLVLARKAGSIRVGPSLAPWLLGVARRLAAKARCRAAAQRAREGRAAQLSVDSSVNHAEPADWEALHDEVGRLPEKYRTPVVLCHLEGLTYEDAARRIGCPVGTVRVRLSRARDRLRERLTRRGLGPTCPALLSVASEGGSFPPVALPAGWAVATARAAWAYTSGKTVAAGLVPAASLALTTEFLMSITLSKFKAALLGVSVLGASAAGAGGYVAFSQDQKGERVPITNRGERAAPSLALPGHAGRTAGLASGPRSKEYRPSPPPDPALPVGYDPLWRKSNQKMLTNKFDALRDRYEKDRSTIDECLETSGYLMRADLRVATNLKDRVRSSKDHLRRIQDVAQRAKAKFQLGKGKQSDLTKIELWSQLARLSLEEAESGLLPSPQVLKPENERGRALRYLEAAKQRLAAQAAFYEEGRITLDRYLDASEQLSRAETQVAESQADRVKAAAHNVERMARIFERENTELAEGRGTIADLAEVEQRLEQAKLTLRDAEQRDGTLSDVTFSRRLEALEGKLAEFGEVDARPDPVAPRSSPSQENEPSLESRLASIENKLERLIQTRETKGGVVPSRPATGRGSENDKK